MLSELPGALAAVRGGAGCAPGLLVTSVITDLWSYHDSFRADGEHPEEEGLLLIHAQVLSGLTEALNQVTPVTWVSFASKRFPPPDANYIPCRIRLFTSQTGQRRSLSSHFAGQDLEKQV